MATTATTGFIETSTGFRFRPKVVRGTFALTTGVQQNIAAQDTKAWTDIQVLLSGTAPTTTLTYTITCLSGPTTARYKTIATSTGGTSYTVVAGSSGSFTGQAAFSGLSDISQVNIQSTGTGGVSTDISMDLIFKGRT